MPSTTFDDRLTARVQRLWSRHASTAFAFAIRVASAVLVLVLQVFLARQMSLNDYGTFVSVTTWIIVIAGFAVMGFGESALRFIPRYAVRERWRDVIAYVRFGLVATVGATTCLSLVVGVVAWTWLDAGTFQTIVLLVAVGLPFVVADFLLEGIGRAMGWYRLAIVPTYILQPIIVVTSLALMSVAGYEIDVVRAALTLVAVTAALTLLKGGLIAVKLGRSSKVTTTDPAQQTPKVRPATWQWHWWRASLPLMAIYGMDDFLLYSDVLLLGILATPSDVGVYLAAVRCLAIANFIHYAFMLVSARKFSLANAVGDRVRLQEEVQDASRMTLLLTVPAVLLTVAVGHLLLGLFGEAFVVAWPVMVILGTGLIVRASTGQAFDLLAVMGHARAVVWMSIGCLGTNIVLSFLLIPAFGIIGAAIATMLVMTVRAALLTMLTHRLTGLSVLAFRNAASA